MVRHCFSAIANRLLPSPESAVPQGGLSSRVTTPSKILRESDIPNVQWSVGLGSHSEHGGSIHTCPKASAVPEVITSTVAGGGGGIVGKKPPPLLEWNPMVHTEWQLGVGARLLPKLPEGTRVGKLVMGKYGLYKPGLYESAQQFFINTELKGMAPEEALPSFALLTKIAKILSIIPILTIVLNVPSLVAQKPVGIYAGRKLPGQK